MGRVEKTIFISYRRTNLPWALAIYQNLTAHGYDVFFDYETIASGDFEQIILGNIRARAHFLVVLTPSALERCVNADDWLRREIETALDEKRNIVPVFLEGFDFGSPSISKYLTGKLENLKKYNGQSVPAGFFDEAMEKLRNKFLNIALDAVLHPVSTTVQKAVDKQQISASKATNVKEKELTAQQWFEEGYKSTNLDERIHCYTEAIRLRPDYAIAYNNRGIARKEKGDLDGAIKDYNEAIRLKPHYAEVYNNRGIARQDKGDLDGAIQDYSLSIELKNPELHLPYYNRGATRKAKGDLDGAIEDYTEAIRLKPDYADAYNNRGAARQEEDDLDGAINDYNEAIRLKPDLTESYFNRGIVRKAKGDLDGAIKDYTEALRLKLDYAPAYRNRGIAWDKKGDYYSAIADFEKSIELGDKEPTILPRIQYLRGLIK
jgi:tetratricopeptide (TPR) repeat protein